MSDEKKIKYIKDKYMNYKFAEKPTLIKVYNSDLGCYQKIPYEELSKKKTTES